MTEQLSSNQEGVARGSRASAIRKALAGSSPSGFRRLGTILLWGIAPLLVGLWLAQGLVPRPAVGIVRLYGDIWAGSTDLVMAQIAEARRDPTIQAVVLQLDSPGGEVAASQTLYLEVQNLRREMPVVGSIDDLAASGAYYVALAADPVYAKPSSTVGNVGAWGYIPPDIGVNEVILSSGPFKLTASNRDEFLRWIESIKREFVATVVSQRGQRLRISDADISQGLAYSGREALGLGLVDQVGSQTDAIRNAAQLAGLAHYDVVDLEARVIDQFAAGNEASLKPWIGAADPATGRRVLPPGAYLLYDMQLGGAP